MTQVNSKWQPVCTAIAHGKSVSPLTFESALLSGELLPDPVREWLISEAGLAWVRNHLQLNKDKNPPHRPPGTGQFTEDKAYIMNFYMRLEVLWHIEEHGVLRKGYLKDLQIQYAMLYNTTVKTISNIYENRKPSRTLLKAAYSQILQRGKSSEEAVQWLSRHFNLDANYEVRRIVAPKP